jgi:hypothetical protein
MGKAINCTFAALVLLTSARAQTSPVMPSAIQVHDVTIADRTVDALITLADKYDVVIGIYGKLVGSDFRRLDIFMKDGTLADVFDLIVRTDPRLVWSSTASGAVHFTFRDDPLSLVEVNIHSVEISNPPRMDLPNLLAEIPEVMFWLHNHNCGMGELLNSSPNEWGKFVVRASGVPFWAVLDQVAAQSRAYVWYAVQDSATPCRVNLSFLSSFHSESPSRKVLR